MDNCVKYGTIFPLFLVDFIVELIAGVLKDFTNDIYSFFTYIRLQLEKIISIIKTFILSFFNPNTF
jgi:hypothetical protein